MWKYRELRCRKGFFSTNVLWGYADVMPVKMSVKMSVEMSVATSVEMPVEIQAVKQNCQFGDLRLSIKQISTMTSELKRAGENLNKFFSKRKKPTYYRKKLIVWELEATREIFCMLNKNDTADGIMSIKEWMKRVREDDGETRKYEGAPLMKQVWNQQQFAWKYVGKKHGSGKELADALQSSPLFTDGETNDVMCKVYSQGVKPLDFMFKDAEIVLKVHGEPSKYGGKAHNEYFTNASHPSLEDTARAVSAGTKKQTECC
jgi:hypothetical protein